MKRFFWRHLPLFIYFGMFALYPPVFRLVWGRWPW